MPLGKSRDVELSMMRADSSVEAQRKTTFARNSIDSRVTPSMTLTPLTRLVFASQITDSTTELGRRVMRFVFVAAGSVALSDEKYDRVMQPRSHGPQ